MDLPSDSSQKSQMLPREHWDSLPELPPFSGPTVPTIGRQFFKHSSNTLLKLHADEGEGILTALAHSIVGQCVPQVISFVTISTGPSQDSEAPSDDRTGLILAYLPGVPLAELWPSLTSSQREAVKSELCGLLVRMRSQPFSYYGRPTRQPYLLFSEISTETYESCDSRSGWDDSRVGALQEHTANAQVAVDLERIQRSTNGAKDWDRPVLTHGDLSDRNILVDPDSLAVTGFLDWEMANIMPAYFEYAAARLLGGHQPEWRKELLDVLRSVLRCEFKTEGQGDVDNDSEQGNYARTLAAWDAVVDVERIAQGYDDDCSWTFERWSNRVRKCYID